MTKRGRGCLIASGVVMFLGIITCFTPAIQTTAGDIFDAAALYPRALVKAKKAGAYITPDDLRRLYGANGKPNAASLYRDAVQTLFSHGMKKYEHWPDVRKALETGSLDQLLSDLKPYRVIEPILDRAAKIPVCDFDPHFEDPLGPSNDITPEMRLLVRIRLAEALLASQNGNSEAALRQVRLANVIGEQIGQGPRAFGSSLKASIRKDVFSVLARLVSNHQRDPAFLSRCRSFVAGASIETDFKKDIDCQLVESLAIADYVRLNGLTELNDARPQFYETWPVVTAAWRTRQLEYWTEVYRRSPKSGTDWRAWEALFAKVQRGDQPSRGYSHEMSKMVDPELKGLGRWTSGAMEAERAAFLTILDVADWTLKHGALPDRPPISRPDPLGSGPLLFRIVGRTFGVWSVGPDGQDNGGLISKESNRDIALVFVGHN